MNTSTDHSPLKGRGIVITRPADQSGRLAALVEGGGGEAILFPLLDIVPLESLTAFDAVIDRIETFDWAIFISSNAAQHGMSRWLARHPVPNTLRFAAVGPMTAAELRAHGVAEVLVPKERFDSESLLALPEMQTVSGRRIVLFRGVGGRELLADVLRERGAAVEYAECYRRALPRLDPQQLADLWQNDRLHAIVVTSSEALRNLVALTGGADWLKATPLFANHPRIAEAAAAQGLRAVTATAPGDEGMLTTLNEYFKTT